MAESDNPPLIEETQREMIELFVQAASLLGLPRSIGEIYGLLYVTPHPLAMDDIIRRLKLSSGSVSQGLKILQSFRAVHTSYQPGQRKNFFEAETEFRKLVSGFIQEEINPHLESAGDKITRLKLSIEQEPDIDKRRFLRFRLEKLEKMHALSAKLIPTLSTLVKL